MVLDNNKKQIGPGFFRNNVPPKAYTLHVIVFNSLRPSDAYMRQ